jgi:hypothetical protein
MFTKTVLFSTILSCFLTFNKTNVHKILSSISERGPLSINASKQPFYAQDSCIDLVFDTVQVIRMEEKFIELAFTIRNKGSVPAPIFGKSRSKQDNVAIHFYFSGTSRMTRGAMLVDGIYLTHGLKDTKGMLAPNAVYSERIKLSLKKRIPLYGVILLQLDAFDVLRQECDETNNVQAITPRWY